MDERTREALVEQFRAYLDREAPAIDTDADPPAPPETPDLFTLLAELGALKNEVKLESRQVKSALDSFRELFDSLRDSHTQLNDEQQRRYEQSLAAERASWRDLLLELLELRDRLQAGREQAARFRPGWFARKGRESRMIGSLAEGMGMNVRRFDEILARCDLYLLPTVGQSFDPQQMHAAELAHDPQRTHGEVVAELRSGWLLHGELLRPAEVVVNRIDSPEKMDNLS